MKNLNVNIDSITAAQILSIPLDRPEKLYIAKTDVEVKALYRKLSMKWHPDRAGDDAANVFAHLKLLYEKAVEKLESGLWNKGQVVILQARDGTKYELKYLVKKEFEMGMNYIANAFVVWVFDEDYQDLAINAVKRIESLKYANADMKKEMTKYLPVIHKYFQTDNKTVVVIKKDPKLIVLRDVLEFYKGKIEPRHVAWIISGMYHISCFLKYNKMVQGGITLDNYFISPLDHSASLLGGWWYASSQNEAIKALPQSAMDVAPIKIINTKKSDFSLDLEMIRLIGRQLLGDDTGVYLNRDKNIPTPLISWLRDSSSSDAFKEYEMWQRQILKDSFGVRRFIELKLTPNDIYQN